MRPVRGHGGICLAQCLYNSPWCPDWTRWERVSDLLQVRTLKLHSSNEVHFLGNPGLFSAWKPPLQRFWMWNKDFGSGGVHSSFGFLGSRGSALALPGVSAGMCYPTASCPISSRTCHAICSNIRSTVILWKEQSILSFAARGGLPAFTLSKCLSDQLHAVVVKSSGKMHVKMPWKMQKARWRLVTVLFIIILYL